MSGRRNRFTEITRWVYEPSVAGPDVLLMLSIAKLRVGQEAYQLSGVAQSLDDYYTGAGETAGVWLGGGAERLGLADQVDADDLRAVLAGIQPGNGGLSPNGDCIRTHVRRVPGFDLTFKPPKSASVLYAVSDDPRVQGAVLDAGETALRAAVGWLEREAIRVRRGSHNQAWLAAHKDEPGAGPRQLDSSGVIAASFRHRTSRAGDPLLHWHVLVANLVEGTDGRWSAFTHPEMYRHMRAAGHVFQAVLRDELTRALGVEWRPGRHFPEIAGIPQALLDRFSKRTQEIDSWLESTGTPDTAEARQAAVLATRRNKPEVEHERFDAAWKLEADEYGWGPAHADALIATAMHRTAADHTEAWRLPTVSIAETGGIERYDRLVDPEEWIETALRQDLTADRSTFTHPDLIAAIAARQGGGTSIETLERITRRVIASPHVIAVATADGTPAWTSRELLGIERRFIDTITTDTVAVPPPVRHVEDAIAARPTLGDDQAAAVRMIGTSTAPVMVLVGPAGTGKTFTLDAIRDAYQHAGRTVIGAAPSARAAIELAAGANLDTSTLHALLDAWRTGRSTPTRRSLLLIDEAGMADVRTLEAVVSRQTGAAGAVLLVGDHHQLPEVGAGGGFAFAVQYASTVVELRVNRRQHQPWERAALTDLRNGNIATAVAAYLGHDRVVTTDSPAAMIDQAVTMWFEAHHDGHRPVLLAGTNEIVDALNRAVISRLDLDTDNHTYDTGEYRIGERVVLRRNSTSEHALDGTPIFVANGQTGTVTGAADERLTIRLDTGGEVMLTDEYLRRGGHVTHAYALTTHRAQGGTWDVAIAVGADGLYKEGADVELSRGASENWIVLTDPEAAELARQNTVETERHDTGLTPPDEHTESVEGDLIDRMRRSRAKQLVHSLDPDADTVDHLARQPFHLLAERLTGATQAERYATAAVGADGDRIGRERDQLVHVAGRVAIGVQVSPTDRHNVGTITDVDDARGEVTVLFVSSNGSHASRRFGWHELRLLDPNTPERELPPSARHTLDEHLAGFDAQIARWAEIVNSFGFEPGDASRYQRAIDRKLDQAAAGFAAEQPSWLTDLIGSRPADVAGARVWDDAVRQVATWQLQHDGTPTATAAWERLNEQLAHTRVWLATTDRTPAAWPIVPSRGELVERQTALDMIFATAPADCRDVINRLNAGQLSFDDTAQLLSAATTQQAARREWIVEHWPHIVEHQEITRTLTTVAWGPDPALLDQILTNPATSERLRHAIVNGEPWIRAVLCRVADNTTRYLTDEDIEVLVHIANHRDDHQIAGREPFGLPHPDNTIGDNMHEVDLLDL